LIAATLQLNAADRVLVLAPHPDDESIACGGLLLAAQSAGATRRVLVVTDGDNNPWPQRWIEKRWRINDAARARWGARRRAEAQAALDVLGVETAERFFFGLPDSTLTSLLMRDSPVLLAQLREHIENFRPTVIAMPVLEDRHPDHSALHIAALLALRGYAGSPPRCLGFSVHGEVASAARIEVPMSRAQEAAKAQAILQHDTQMRLSRKRFIAFAKSPENYRAQTMPPPQRTSHPLRGRVDAGVTLRLQLDAAALHGTPADYHLLVLLGAADPSAEIRHWRVPIGKPEPVDAARTDAPISTWRDSGSVLELDLSVETKSPPALAFAKLVRNRAGLVIYDRYGWQNLAIERLDLGKS
jgi:LmbE family N-acetylglucosaminyl deacetylase